MTVGVCAEEISEQLAPYLKQRSTGRPWVVLKLAASLDGRTAAPDGTSQWITGPLARADAHRLRAESDAVLVGAGTVRADDPALTVRDSEGGDPLRVVLGHIPDGARVHPALELGGDLGQVLDELGRRDVVQLLVEGGATVAHDFHRAGLVDRYVLYLAPVLFGGDDGRAALRGPGRRLDGRGVAGPDGFGRTARTRSCGSNWPATASGIDGRRTGACDVHRDRGGDGAGPPPRRRAASSSRPRVVTDDANVGDSIAVNGCCLTVVDFGDRLVRGRRGGRDAVPDQSGPAGSRVTRSTSSGPFACRTASAVIWSRATWTPSGEVVTPAPDLRVRVPARPQSLPRREGLDHRRWGQPHRGGGARRRLHGGGHPPHRRVDHPRVQGAGGAGQPGGRPGCQVRGAPAGADEPSRES